MVAPYGFEHPKDRAPFYATVACDRCLTLNELTYTDGTFICEWCLERSRRWQLKSKMAGL